LEPNLTTIGVHSLSPGHFPCNTLACVRHAGFWRRDRVFETKAEKPHEREVIAKLIFRLIVRKIVERLYHQSLEDHQFVPRLASRQTLARRIARAKLAYEQRPLSALTGKTPMEHRRDGNQWIVF
jgi:hypothetical protein